MQRRRVGHGRAALKRKEKGQNTAKAKNVGQEVRPRYTKGRHETTT